MSFVIFSLLKPAQVPSFPNFPVFPHIVIPSDAFAGFGSKWLLSFKELIIFKYTRI